MSRQLKLSLLAGTLLVLIGGTISRHSVSAGKLPADVPVTVLIADTAGGIPLQIQSDGAGTYKNTSAVQSIIQGIGDWELDTSFSASSTRNVWVDLGKPVPGSGPNGGPPIAPFTAGLVKVGFISKCSLYNVNMFTIPVGSTVNCPLASGFDYGDERYRIHMNPIAGVDVNPETDFVNITCNAINTSSKCISWSMNPSGLKGGCATADCSVKQNIARLSKMVTVRGRLTPISQGDFYIGFAIGITNP